MIFVSIFPLLQGGGMLYIPCSKSSSKKSEAFEWGFDYCWFVWVEKKMGKPDRVGKKSTNTFLLSLQFRLYFIALFDIKRNLNRNTFMLPSSQIFFNRNSFARKLSVTVQCRNRRAHRGEMKKIHLICINKTTFAFVFRILVKVCSQSIKLSVC